MSEEKKNFTLKFIQIAWVAELITILLYTMIALPLLGPELLNIWLQFLPLFGTLIGAQGIAATGGPLMADHIHRNRGGTHE
jgi:hypothetical protein